MPPTIRLTVGIPVVPAVAEPELDPPQAATPAASAVAHASASIRLNMGVSPPMGVLSDAAGFGDGGRPPGQHPPLERGYQPLRGERHDRDDQHRCEDNVGVEVVLGGDE